MYGYCERDRRVLPTELSATIRAAFIEEAALSILTRQLGDIRRDPPRFIPREQFRRRSFARGLYDGRDHEREFGRSFSGKVIAVREIVILKFVDRGNEV